MFSYYGSKSKIVSRYPPPNHQRLIEPFAGSARYALRFPERDVWLNDLNPTIAGVWEYLVNVTAGEIERLPDQLPQGADLRDYPLTEEQRTLLGFAVGRGRAAPGHTVTKWSAERQDMTRLKQRVKFGGKGYPVRSVCFDTLGQWCRSRPGQVIVCESDGADWLPFVPLARIQGQANTMRTELIWTTGA